MSLYKVKNTPVSVRGSVFDPGQEVELSDEELNNIGADYFEKVEGSDAGASDAGKGEGEGGDAGAGADAGAGEGGGQSDAGSDGGESV